MERKLCYLSPFFLNFLKSVNNGLRNLLVTFGSGLLELFIDVDVHLFHGKLRNLPATMPVEYCLIISVEIFKLIAIKPVLTWLIRGIHEDGCS